MDINSTDTEIAKALYKPRMTIHRWRKQGKLEGMLQSLTESVTKSVTMLQNVIDVTPNVTLNWERNKNPLTGKSYETKAQALATAAFLVLKDIPESTILLGGELMSYDSAKRKLR